MNEPPSTPASGCRRHLATKPVLVASVGSAAAATSANASAESRGRYRHGLRHPQPPPTTVRTWHLGHGPTVPPGVSASAQLFALDRARSRPLGKPDLYLADLVLTPSGAPPATCPGG